MVDWKQAVASDLGSDILDTTTIGGGDFAQSYRANLADERTIFIKTHANPPPNFFTTEAKGLDWLRSTGAVNVPQVLAVSDDPPYLAMEWINIGGGIANDERFGQELAALHQSTFPCFGRPDSRTTGSQAVPNNACDTWSEFYATQRLLPLAKLAHEKSALPESCISGLEKLASRLDQFDIADEAPCLLHGDLWAGNRVVDQAGVSWLIDPAAHGGHREFDLAMMQLFGGYGEACFSAYNTVFALNEEWQSRVALHQLAPLTVHAIKFGGSYVAATQGALSQYL